MNDTDFPDIEGDDDLVLPSPESAAIRDVVFHDVIAARRAEQAYNKERSKAGWWIGGIGAAVGVIGISCAAIVMVSHLPQVRYTEIDDASGVVRESFGAKDAPDHYNDRVTKRYLTDYVNLRESFVWQMDPQTDHLVKIMSAPAEQVRYSEEKQKARLLDKYGQNGFARVNRMIDFRLRATGEDRTFEYDVQFEKAEVLAVNPSQTKLTRMTARIGFQWHPELDMNAQDRLHNEAGFWSISYHSDVDP